MYPAAPPLWEKHHNGDVVGVSDDPPGETYWKVANGIRLTGMPAYKEVLTDNEMWQVSLLLANADKPLPPAAVAILNGETAPACAGYRARQPMAKPRRAARIVADGPESSRRSMGERKDETLMSMLDSARAMA